MTRTAIGILLALTTAHCATDGEHSRATERELAQGQAGSGAGADDFGNSDNPVPPPPVGTVIVGGDCKPGHYLGQLEGMYESGAAFGFTPGGIPISTDPKFISTDVLNALFPPMGGVSPGFEFWLNATGDTAPCEVGEEFCFDYVVEGGKARGVANGLFPFEMDINGQLDCSGGTFQGLLENGWYDVAGIRFFYEGTIESAYDSNQSAFFDGTWEVSEPADPNAGGTGTWYTAYVGP